MSTKNLSKDEEDRRTGLKAVLFDFDGTLVRLNADFGSLREELQALLEPCGYHSSFPHIYQCAEEAGECLEKQHGKSTASAVMARVWAAFHTTEMHAVPQAELLPGVPEVWRWLQDRCVPVAIVSNNHSDAIKAILDRLGVPLPPVIVGREQVHRVKPDPEGAMIALERLGLDVEGVWMVGDSTYDSDVGITLKVKVAIVASPWKVPAPQEDTRILRLDRIDALIPIWTERHGYE